ncbi:MAG: carboxypeptidase regulatory-like domain-containing protein [Actinobacteria bacterium]|nr:carboxypeptidase regulatory-like domain-containing protein [Actinomycetota bacterium]
MPPSASGRASIRGLAALISVAIVLALAATPSPAGPLPFAAEGAMAEAYTGVVDAFGTFEAAAARLADGATDEEAAAVVAARDALLVSAVTLLAAVQAAPTPVAGAAAPSPCGPDLAGVDSTYSVDCTLIVDVGGDDTYSNNAGGAHGGAAAVIDLSGNDRYGGTRSSGANGGAVAGAGFLFDAAGNDTYSAGTNGTNGGSYFFGVGFLLDGAGNDRYTAGHNGTNGGGASVGQGTLIDLGGDDTYSAGRTGVNGGSDGTGRGLLVDAGGTDSYADLEACTGSGTDRSVAPKALVGAQLDSTAPGPAASCLPAVPNPPPPQLGSVTGTVSEAKTGAGIIGAIVECGGLQTAGVSLVAGRYVIPVAPATTFKCTASATGYRSKSGSVTVENGAIATLDFALQKAR